MKYTTSTLAGGLLAALLMAGCCPDKSQQANQGSPAPAASTVVAAAGQAQATLRVTPSALRECEVKPGAGVVAQVAWDAMAARVTTAKVWVKAPSGENKLWTAGGGAGQVSTGPWTVPGTVFTLTDGNDRQLAQATVAQVPCR